MGYNAKEDRAFSVLRREMPKKSQTTPAGNSRSGAIFPKAMKEGKPGGLSCYLLAEI